MNSKIILKMLAERHTADVFVPECKTGPTWSGAPIRLDAWAMRRSWAAPVTWGYEIKISRSDFVRDDKWRAYLPYCTDFYFAAPHGMIQPEELPPEAGLLWASKTGSRLFLKRKAIHRKIDVQSDLLMYVLMSRARLGERCLISGDADESGKNYWRQWLEEKADKRRLGERVSAAIRTHVATIEAQNHQLAREHSRFRLVNEFCASAGINIHDWNLAQTLRERLAGDIPRDIREDMKSVRDSLASLLQRLDNVDAGEGCASND